MPDKVGGVILYDLAGLLENPTGNLRVKAGTVDSDKNVVAITTPGMPGHFTGISVYRYNGSITAGTISFYPAKSGQRTGEPATLGAGGTAVQKAFTSGTYTFEAGDLLQAEYERSADYASSSDTAFTVGVWFAYDY